MPVFAARTSKSVTTARSCLRISPTGRGKIESTERVFCAVTHVTTDVPCTPIEANDLRSAWIPAPPPESLPAIVNAVRTGRAMGAAGLRLTRGSFDPGRRHPDVQSDASGERWVVVGCGPGGHDGRE